MEDRTSSSSDGTLGGGSASEDTSSRNWTGFQSYDLEEEDLSFLHQRRMSSITYRIGYVAGQAQDGLRITQAHGQAGASRC
jgi:hypothetical protein